MSQDTILPLLKDTYINKEHISKNGLSLLCIWN